MGRSITREQALKWWGTLKAPQKQKSCSKYHFNRLQKSMTGKEIEDIYKSEMLTKDKK